MSKITDCTTAEVWSALDHGADWHAMRRKGIGGSDAKRIMDGQWLHLWEEKTGRTAGDDLSDVLAVQMGSWTEPLNRAWFERQTGLHVRVVDAAIWAASEDPPMYVNLDGTVGEALFEAKHLSPFGKEEEWLSRYWPQCQHALTVTRAPLLYLSVFAGNAKWLFWEVEPDPAYQGELVRREREFWSYVERDEAPDAQEAVQAVVSADQWREVDMTGSNEFASFAADWLESKAAAKKFDTAVKGLKELVEADVGRAFGHGIEIKRSKSNALTVKELKA